MRIPNADTAIIEEQKLVDYLLNPDHRRGGGKATLLLQFGYTPADWQQLASDLRRDHLTRDAAVTRASPYGERYGSTRTALDALRTPTYCSERLAD